MLGRGDPTISTQKRSLRSDYPTRIGEFVKAIRSAGIRRIRGSVAASKSYFKRDWDAPGVGDWGEFAILSRGLTKERAVEAEDRLVRLASSRARP
ncbi:MAG: hypothetical protein M3198_01760 [Actinomycetota bacterium]|nr:hypothetical protein [Actinomycetota bacterium]